MYRRGCIRSFNIPRAPVAADKAQKKIRTDAFPALLQCSLQQTKLLHPLQLKILHTHHCAVAVFPATGAGLVSLIPLPRPRALMRGPENLRRLSLSVSEYDVCVHVWKMCFSFVCMLTRGCYINGHECVHVICTSVWLLEVWVCANFGVLWCFWSVTDIRQS